MALNFKNVSLNVGTNTDIGVFMGTSEGIAAGAVPDPGTSGDNPGWMYRNRIHIAGNSQDTPEDFFLEKDIRAMRKFDAQDRDVALVFDVGAGSDVTINGLVRLLIMLP